MAHFLHSCILQNWEICSRFVTHEAISSVFPHAAVCSYSTFRPCLGSGVGRSLSYFSWLRGLAGCAYLIVMNIYSELWCLHVRFISIGVYGRMCVLIGDEYIQCRAYDIDCSTQCTWPDMCVRPRWKYGWACTLAYELHCSTWTMASWVDLSVKKQCLGLERLLELVGLSLDVTSSILHIAGFENLCRI